MRFSGVTSFLYRLSDRSALVPDLAWSEEFIDLAVSKTGAVIGYASNLRRADAWNEEGDISM